MSLSKSTTDIDLYRSAFQESITTSRQSELYRSLPIAYMWDDHDYGKNNSDKSSPSREAARLAYREIVPHYNLPAGSGDAPITVFQAAALNRGGSVKGGPSKRLLMLPI